MDIKRTVEKLLFGSSSKGSNHYKKSVWNGHSVENKTSGWQKINKFSLRNRIDSVFEKFKNIFR